jgi:HicB family
MTRIPGPTDDPRPISRRRRDIIVRVKQLLLRVPEDLHRRLAARAAREGRSMNAIAGAILDAWTDVDLGIPPNPPPTPQQRLRARAAALGMLSREIPARPVSEAERERIIASTRGIGPIVDRLIDEDRGRLS